MINELAPLLLFSLSTTFTPGPNNIMIMNSGLNFGVIRSLPHYLGICLGFPIMVLMVALGLGVIFTQYNWIKHILKILGSIYMLYLAWQILRSSKETAQLSTRQPLSFFHLSKKQAISLLRLVASCIVFLKARKKTRAIIVTMV